MALHQIILDSRIHRTVRLSTDTQEYNLAPSSGYVVLLRSINGRDTLTVSRGGQLIWSIETNQTFTPPNTGTSIHQIQNPAKQFQVTIDDTQYRILELEQNLCDPAHGILYAQSYATAAAPLSPTHGLVVQPTGGQMVAMGDGGIKVPPYLG
jgi:hypothetical protein